MPKISKTQKCRVTVVVFPGGDMFRGQTIQVLTTHFSGVLCSYCGSEENPPHLMLRLYGKEVKRKRMEATLKLLAWDQRLQIRDFRKLALPNAREESTLLVSERGLEPVSTPSGVELGVQLDLQQEDDISWKHKFLDASGNPKFPEVRREALTSLLVCEKSAADGINRPPAVFEWAFQLENQTNSTGATEDHTSWFSCTIDVGYVREEEEDKEEEGNGASSALHFLHRPKKQTLMVNDLKDHHYHDAGERTTPKQFCVQDYMMEQGAVGGSPCLTDRPSTISDLPSRDSIQQEKSCKALPVLNFNGRIKISHIDARTNKDAEMTANNNQPQASPPSPANAARSDELLPTGLGRSQHTGTADDTMPTPVQESREMPQDMTYLINVPHFENC